MISVLSETQERFFLAIGKQLPLERVIELHLFQPIRQGGVESGVAVVAAVPEGEALADDASAESAESDASESDTATPATASADETREPHDHAATGDDEDALDSGEPAGTDDSDEDDFTRHDDESLDAIGRGAEDDTDTALDGVEESDEGDVTRSEADAAEPAPEDITEEAPAAERPRRYTVYTAHYRHVLKGPDRGKWEVSVVAEADAPLLTVDVVVRGVLRRSGDAAEVERLSGDEVRKALKQTTAPPAAPARASR